jgi:hypothetical protein
MSIYSVRPTFRLGRDADGNTTYGTAWYPDTYNQSLLPGVEVIVPIPTNQFNWALFYYEPGGNSIMIKPDDGVALAAPTTSLTKSLAEYNPPLKYIAQDTGLRLLSVLGANIIISFTIGAPL